MRMEATIAVTGLHTRSGPWWRWTGCRSRCCRLAAAVAGGLAVAWLGPGVAGEGIGVGGGELPDAVEEAADHQELVVGVADQEVPGAADEVAEDFLVPAAVAWVVSTSWRRRSPGSGRRRMYPAFSRRSRTVVTPPVVKPSSPARAVGASVGPRRRGHPGHLTETGIRHGNGLSTGASRHRLVHRRLPAAVKENAMHPLTSAPKARPRTRRSVSDIETGLREKADTAMCEDDGYPVIAVEQLARLNPRAGAEDLRPIEWDGGVDDSLCLEAAGKLAQLCW